MTATTATSGLIQAGTTKLYHEVRGSGPALLITGGTGDAGEWANLAPAVVIGHSGGASVACSLAVRHPELVRHAVLYEPPLLAMAPEALVAGLRAVIEQAMTEGRPRHAMEAFIRGNAGDEVADQWFETLDPSGRDPILDNGAVFFPIELPAFAAFIPDPQGTQASGVPLTVVAGEQNRDTWMGLRRPGWPRGPAPTSSSCPVATAGSSATRRSSLSWCAASSRRTHDDSASM